MSQRVEGIEEEDLRRRYDVENMLQYEIADQYGVSSTTIQRRMYEYDIERRGNEDRRKYAINENFFDVWTKESAWLTGWAIGDGNYISSFTLRFIIQRRDEEVLHKFKDVLLSEHCIEPIEIFNKRTKKTYKKSRISFNSKKLVECLRKLSYLDIPNEYIPDFVRGFWEAEGSTSWHRGQINSDFSQKDKTILEYIHKQLKELGIVKGGSLAVNNSWHGWRISLCKHDSIALYHFMYDNCKNMFLKRKKEKFETLLEREKELEEKRKNPHPLLKDKEWLRPKYKRLKIKELAKLIGCRDTTLSLVLGSFQIPIRKQGVKVSSN